MIEVSHLTKYYGHTAAVRDLSFTIEKGKIYGLLGPNGAGKSTTMNIMAGCLAASSGTVTIGGHDILDEAKEAKMLLGYLPEFPPLYSEQTPREYLTFVAEGKHVPKGEIAAQIDSVAEQTHIEDVLDKVIAHLSKGYKQRVGIAQALLGSPEVIILDEPTVGLDPLQIIEIRDLIRSLGQTHTVVLSSHILSEVQAVCEEVLIIHHGQLIAFDKIENLSQTLSGGSRISLKAEAAREEISNALSSVEGVESVTDYETQNGITTAVVHLSGDPELLCRTVSRALADHQILVLQLTPEKEQLEDIFIEMTSSGEEPSPAPVPDGEQSPKSEDPGKEVSE